MIKSLSQELFDEGYNVLLNGEPLKIEGSIEDFITSQDVKDPSVYIIADLLKLSRKELEIHILK